MTIVRTSGDLEFLPPNVVNRRFSVEEIRRVVRHTDLITPPPGKRLRDLLNEISAGDEE